MPRSCQGGGGEGGWEQLELTDALVSVWNENYSLNVERHAGQLNPVNLQFFLRRALRDSCSARRDF